MKNILNKEQGMTLVELLAAIALLGIVLFTFMSIFTQSAKFSAHNQETLTAVQIAEQVVSDVRDLETIFSLNNIGSYKKTGSFIEDKDTYDHFVVKISEEPVQVIRPDAPATALTINKANISVKAKPGFGINEPEFKTEMYLKVQP
ncbi:type II secretion system protein [Planomicrobium sp. Y74]|uniref:type IV pilus modification PilV family protein n=1 Tax=Planomicrobium sp. Y74 TaxID=2478977 RepID=UPI000EF4BF21|nr:type II secretion system protein [Planomicrobium sp. Y74]RLQ91920.1 type II secretion system protein [Planomicrobium sp. Y74]